MDKTTKDNSSQSMEKGTGFLLWGLIGVTMLNLVMILGSTALFAP